MNLDLDIFAEHVPLFAIECQTVERRERVRRNRRTQPLDHVAVVVVVRGLNEHEAKSLRGRCSRDRRSRPIAVGSGLGLHHGVRTSHHTQSNPARQQILASGCRPLPNTSFPKPARRGGLHLGMPLLSDLTSRGRANALPRQNAEILRPTSTPGADFKPRLVGFLQSGQADCMMAP